MLKIKIPEFSEKQYSHEGWREARAGAGGSGGATDGAELIRFEMLAAITPQRMASVVSKRGVVDPRDKVACRALLNEYMEDVIESLTTDRLLDACHGDLRGWYPELARELESESRKVVAAHLRAPELVVVRGKESVQL